MICEIIKILPITKSVNGNNYIRVEMKDQLGNFYKTDLCPNYRNYKRWKKFLKVGTLIKHLIIKDEKTVDADSYPEKATLKPKVELSDMAQFAKYCL
jgi:hypothetical protein